MPIISTSLEEMNVDPKDLGRTLMDAGVYQGEIQDIKFVTVAEGDAYGTPGDRKLEVRFLFEGDHGQISLIESFQMQGRGAFMSGNVLKALGVEKGNALWRDITQLVGTKVVAEYDTPQRSEKTGRSYNKFIKLTKV